jgi:hypothetical protein
MDEKSCIPEALILARIAQSEQLRAFFVQMWRENPQMAAKAGERIQALMSPLAVPPVPKRGFPSVTPTFAAAARIDR